MKIHQTKTVLIALATLVGMSAAVMADPVTERKALMKKTVLPAVKLTGGMVKDASTFDAAKAEEAARTIASVPAKFVKLFPEDSAGDPDSEAKDVIWSDMKGFLAAADKMATSANAAADAAKSGHDAFKGAFIKMTETCKGCHQVYRVKKE